MPTIALPVAETYESITRPVAYDIIRSLIDITGIPKDINILFPGEDKQAPMPGSTLDDTEGYRNSFGNSARFTVEVTEEFLEQDVFTTAANRPEHVLAFKDGRLGVAIRPIYAPMAMTLNIVYRGQSRNEVSRWRNEMHSRVAMGRQHLLHEITYHYPIPPTFLVILHHIHELRERQAPYGESLQEWLRGGFTPLVSTKVTHAGTEPLLVINERQIGVIGQFEFEAVPDNPTRSGETATWETSFSYRVVYDRVGSCVMQYPLMVHNQLIDRKFRSTEPRYDFEKQRIPQLSLSRFAMDGIRGAREFRSPMAGYTIPHWDEWIPESVPPFTTTMINALLGVSPDDPNHVADLNKLGSYEIREEIREFLKEEAPYLGIPGQSVFLVTLFRGNVPLESGSVTVDEELRIRSREPMDLRQTYHVRLSVVNDMFTLSKAAQDRLRNRGKVCLLVLGGLYSELGIEGQLPRLMGGNYVARKDFEHAAQRIKDTQRPHVTDVEIARLKIGNFIITARGEERN